MHRRAIALLIAGLLIAPAANALTIELNYSYDTSGMFSSTTAQNVMNQAVASVGSQLTNSLVGISSNGPNSYDISFLNPSTGSTQTISGFSVAADTIDIFVGGQALGSGILGEAGLGGFSVSGTGAFRSDAVNRSTLGGSLEAFAGWGGAISFNSTANWYVGNNPTGSSGYDLYSVAVHELGHVLGYDYGVNGQGQALDTWSQYVQSGSYYGPNSEAAYGGPVPLASDSSHWASGTTSDVNGISQAAAMDPTMASGQRRQFTTLDYAGLQDIGWNVSIAPVPLPSSFLLMLSAVLAAAGWGARRARHPR